jgi:hypothetical protein
LAVAACVTLAGGCPGANTSDPNDPNNAAQAGDTTGTGTGDTNGTGTGTGDTNGSGTGTGTGDTNGSGTGTGTGGTNGSGSGGTSGGGTSGGGGSGGSGGSGGGTGGTPPPAPVSVSLTAVAKTGDAVPGQASGVTFTTFANPVLDSQGRVAFWGLYGGTGAMGTGGLYVWNGTAVESVLDNDPNSAGVVPSRSSPYYFQYDPNQPDLAWGGGDRLLFCAQIVPASGASGNMVAGVYRWRATDGNLVRVADREQVAATFPDVQKDSSNNPSFEGRFLSPGVSDNGLASFGVHYTYIRDPNTASGLDVFVLDKNAVFTSNGTTVTKLADENTKTAGIVPDQPPDAYYSTVVTATTINGSGDMLFQAGFTSTASTGRGVFLERSGASARVIDNRTGASWPGLPAGAQFLMRSPALGYAMAGGPAGQIAVAGRMTVSGTTDSAVIQWDWTAASWAELTGSGGIPATALLSGVNDDGQAAILAGGNPFLASSTAAAQLNATLPTTLQGATLVWLDSGGAVSDYGRALLPYTNSGKPGLALWTSEQLLVVADAQLGAPAGLAEIHTITGSEQDRPGRSGLLNDSDEMVFRAVMTDTTQAIYLAQGG